MVNHSTALWTPREIRKRDGSTVPFDYFKIREAIEKANREVPEEVLTADKLDHLTERVVSSLDAGIMPEVEKVQDLVELILMREGVYRTAKAYTLYRSERASLRESRDYLMERFKKLSYTDAASDDGKRENANVDGNTAMGMMLKYGSESSKYFIDHYVLPKEMAKAHEEGDIHIHDKDFYLLTETCCQIDLDKLFKGGFSTGHGVLREPQSIESYAALACIALQANQNEMHGGQSIPNFDNAMAKGVEKSFQKIMKDLREEKELFLGGFEDKSALPEFKSYDEFHIYLAGLEQSGDTSSFEWKFLDLARRKMERSTYQAMQSLIHNLNTMNSRAGAQVPFSSINYGTGITPAARLVTRMILQATEDGLGNGETPIFPVQIFKVKEGISSEALDPNYDLFQRAIEVSSKRLFPNFSFLDAPFNLKYYKEGDDNTEVSYMGCRTRVMGNVFDPEREVTKGRGNLSFTSINLPRIGILAGGSLEKFYALLEDRMELCFRQLRHRFEIQKRKRVENYPFLMGEGVWIDSETLGAEEEIDRILRHGTLSVGFIGLAETLVALRGAHHGEEEASQDLGLEIIRFMRKKCDERASKEKLNYTLLATPAEGLSGRFVGIDRRRFGSLTGITDHEFYTNSFHIPVYFPIGSLKKISLEAPYHELTNAGHITYVELDGNARFNPSAMEMIIRHMKNQGVGYGSINHPLDRDPVCGYQGVIGDSCPKCHREETPEVPFDRIRRITGYLVGTLDRFNDAKRSEVKERVKHV